MSRFGLSSMACVLLAVAPALGLVSTNLLLPVFPEMQRAGYSLGVLNAGVSSFLIVFAAAQLLCGFAITLRTLRPALTISLLVSGGAAVAFGISGSGDAAFLATRVVFAVGMGVVVVGCRFALGRIVDDRRRNGAFVISNLAFIVLPAIAIIVAVPLARVAGAAVIVAAPGVLAIAIAAGIRNADLGSLKQDPPRPRAIGAGLSWGVAVSSALFYANLYAIYLWLSNLADISDLERVTLFLAGFGLNVLGGVPAWVGILPSERLYRYAAYLLPFAAAVSLLWLWVGLAALIFLCGIIMPLSLSLFLGGHGRGNALPASVIGSIQLAGGFAGAWLIELVRPRLPLEFAAVLLGFSVAGLLVYASASRRD